jgi:putative ATP-dependent endonuclease of OLD family
VRLFRSHPTLEPSVTVGNEAYVAAALSSMGVEVPNPNSQEAVHELFRGRRAARPDRDAIPAGPLAQRKGEFALAMASAVRDAREAGSQVRVPDAMGDLLDFLYENHLQSAAGQALDGKVAEEPSISDSSG